jgi:hypothetical protein
MPEKIKDMNTVCDTCEPQPNALSIERRRPVESDLFSLPLYGGLQGKAKT